MNIQAVSNNDQRVVATLDAGGTNFVFSAIQEGREIISPILLRAHTNNLDRCLNGILNGFSEVIGKVSQPISAISFAFPGPADYPKGIIGDLPNFPAFVSGVALGPMLEDYFKVPVFINNDGDLFAYGEALMGFLPEVNNALAQANSPKRYSNLIGITLGTGFGCGIVINDALLRGDNSCNAEIHNTLNAHNPDWNAEESVSTRAIQHTYCDQAGIPFYGKRMPADIYQIAKGHVPGNKTAAIEAFDTFGKSLGSSLVNILSLIDGIVVLGGGLAGGWDLFAPSMFKEINRDLKDRNGEPYKRLSFNVFNLEDSDEFSKFSKGNYNLLKVPKSNRSVEYDSFARTGVGLSKLGASKAIALGAYIFAIQELKKSNI